MHADQRLSVLCGRADEFILTFRQVDIRCVHAFSHRGHGTGSMLASQSQDHGIRFPYRLESLFKSALVLPRNGIAVCIEELCLRHTLPQLGDKTSAVRFLKLQDIIEKPGFVGLDLSSGHPFFHFRIQRTALLTAFYSRNGICHSIDGFHHTQMGVTAEKFPGAVRMGTDHRQFPDFFLQRKRAVVP